jgi:hypothetical protein
MTGVSVALSLVQAYLLGSIPFTGNSVWFGIALFASLVLLAFS